MADVVISATASPHYTVTKGVSLKNLSNKREIVYRFGCAF